MRRAVAILKYVPAVLCGLLVVAWVVSQWMSCGLTFSLPTHGRFNQAMVISHRGTIALDLDADKAPARSWISPLDESEMRAAWSGRAGLQRSVDDDGSTFWVIVFVPIPLIFSLLLFLAVGSFSSFRFPLWSYFAWTALIAAELAYYLR